MHFEVSRNFHEFKISQFLRFAMFLIKLYIQGEILNVFYNIFYSDPTDVVQDMFKLHSQKYLISPVDTN